MKTRKEKMISDKIIDIAFYLGLSLAVITILMFLLSSPFSPIGISAALALNLKLPILIVGGMSQGVLLFFMASVLCNVLHKRFSTRIKLRSENAVSSKDLEQALPQAEKGQESKGTPASSFKKGWFKGAF